MSYPRDKAASTPMTKADVSLHSNSTSPILTTLGPSRSRQLGRTRGQKRQRSPLSKTSGKLKIQRRAHENDVVREAPPPVADIRSIIDEPLYPRPQVVPPKDDTERIDRDVEYVQVPEPEATCSSNERAEKNTESGESEEEYHVLRPQKVYEGPRTRNPPYTGAEFRIKDPHSDYVRKFPNNGVPGIRLYNCKSEAEDLWDEHLKEEAEKFAEQQRGTQRKTIRNREIRLRLRKEAAQRVAAAKLNKSSRGKKAKKSKEPEQPERSPSPEMITMRVKGDWSEYTIIRDANPDSPVTLQLDIE